MPDTSGHLAYYVAIDVAALALHVTIARARKLAHKEKWRRTPTRPTGYLMEDIAKTATKRKAHRS